MKSALDKRPPSCSLCGSENDADEKFCNECSAPLFVRCVVCGLSNRTTAKFCGECAAPLEAARTPVQAGSGQRLPLHRLVPGAPLASHSGQGERRHLTVLFCDLVGSTEMAGKLDPEDWHETLANYHVGAAEA